MDPSSDTHGLAGVHVHTLRRAGRAALAGIPLLLPPAAGAAQEHPEPRLLLSIFGGVSGGRSLWEINRQPLLVIGTEAAPRYDTLRISRSIGAGFVLGLSAAFFRSANLGITGEIVYLGLRTDDQCTLIHESPGADLFSRNAQICQSITTQSVSPTTVGFFLGGVYRVAPRGFASPYGRLQAGFGTHGGSIVEVSGAFVDASGIRRRAVVRDDEPMRIHPSVGAALGVMIRAGPGYQARLELRDQMLWMNRVTGPADVLGTAPTSRFLMHNIALTAALDIVLEQRRGRRY